MQRVLPLIATLALALPPLTQAGRQARTIPWTQDWLTAIRVVQTPYPGSAGWLISCSSSEGAHGAWVWRGGEPVRFSRTGRLLNDHGNVPGGNMQYFRSTFEADWIRAVADLLRRGYRVPNGAASWFSPLGQALAAGWAYYHNRPPGKWTGRGC